MTEMAQYVFTPEGFEELKRMIKETEERLRGVTRAKGDAVAGQDGWHDEGYQRLEAEERMLSKRLGDLQDLHSNPQVIEPEEQCICVRIGTGVRVEYENGSTCYLILDGYTVGSLKGRVSVYSPLGRALLGAVKEERREFKVGDVVRAVTIKEIFPPSLAGAILERGQEASSGG